MRTLIIAATFLAATAPAFAKTSHHSAPRATDDTRYLALTEPRAERPVPSIFDAPIKASGTACVWKAC